MSWIAGIGAVAMLFSVLLNLPAVPVDYAKKTETGGKIEAVYLAEGEYETASVSQTALQGFGKYQIYYPAELEKEGKQYPVVVFANGTGVPVSKYKTLLKHLASWGFIAIGTEEEYDWNGFSSEMCIRHLTRLNENETLDEKENIFYQKIDLDNVGITGHSQGGVGVINAATTQKHSEIYKAAVILSPPNQELADSIEWEYDTSKLTVPTLLMAGDNDWVIDGEQLRTLFEQIPAAKCMARRKDTEHGTMLYSADGYVTAWFMYWLQGDEQAAAAFYGEEAELAQNPLYQDVRLEMQQP